MPQTAILRTRIEPRRKRRAEKILSRLGLSPSQAINLFYTQVELHKGLPFAVTLNDPTTGNSDILPAPNHYTQMWNELDDEDFSHLDPR